MRLRMRKVNKGNASSLPMNSHHFTLLFSQVVMYNLLKIKEYPEGKRHMVEK